MSGEGGEGVLFVGHEAGGGDYGGHSGLVGSCVLCFVLWEQRV